MYSEFQKWVSNLLSGCFQKHNDEHVPGLFPDTFPHHFETHCLSNSRTHARSLSRMVPGSRFRDSIADQSRTVPHISRLKFRVLFRTLSGTLTRCVSGHSFDIFAINLQASSACSHGHFPRLFPGVHSETFSKVLGPPRGVALVLSQAWGSAGLLTRLPLPATAPDGGN